MYKLDEDPKIVFVFDKNDIKQYASDMGLPEPPDDVCFKILEGVEYVVGKAFDDVATVFFEEIDTELAERSNK